jgi:hypothetical protein
LAWIGGCILALAGEIPGESWKQQSMPPDDLAAPFALSLDRQPREKRWCHFVAALADQYRKPLLIVLVLFYFCGFNGQWQLGPDSALYLSLARNIALGRGYTYHGIPHTMVYPGLPYALALFFKLFRSTSAAIVAADVLMLLCGFGVLAATYRLVLLAFGRPSAVMVTLGLGITREFYRYCFEILTDMPFLLGVTLFLAGQEAIFQSQAQIHRKIRWFDWAFLIGGLGIAISTRPNMIGLLLVWISSILWSAIRNKNARPMAILMTCIGLLVTALFVHFDPRHAGGTTPTDSYENTVLNDLTRDFSHRLTVDVPANIHDLFGASAARAAFGMPLGSWWINALFGTLIISAALALFRKRFLWGAWVAITILTVIFIQSHDRYMLQILPFIVLGWWRLLVALNEILPRKIGNGLLVLCLALGTIPNMLQCGNIVLNQHARPFIAKYRDGEYQAYVQLAQKLPEFAPPQSVILGPSRVGRILTFLSDRNVFETDEPGFGNLAAKPPLVILDPDDLDFRVWLKSQSFVLDANPLLSISRGKSAPLQLFATHVQ